jgi:hypothetical protein
MPIARNAASPGGGNTFVPALGKKKPVAQYDADGFHTLKNIPVFDAHDGRGEDLDVQFDEPMLKRIVEQCNSRIRDTGDEVPITDRHTSEDPHAEEPEILGYACNFSMGTVGKTNPRPCIMADLKIHKSKMAKAKTLPRRSIELWPDLCIDPVVLKKADKPAIDSVALLGSERPARDLGLLFAKNKNCNATYQYEISPEESMNPNDLQQVIEALMATPEFAFIKDLMAKEQSEPAQMEEERDEMEEEPAKMADDPDKDAEEEKEILVGKEEEKEEEELLDPAKLRMQRDQQKRRYAKLETQYNNLSAKVAELEKDKRIAQRKSQLLQLEAEGFVFDFTDELEYVADLEPARYSKHLAKIKKNYKKAPVGVNVKVAAIPAEGGLPTGASDPQEVMRQAAVRASEKYSNRRN